MGKHAKDKNHAHEEEQSLDAFQLTRQFMAELKRDRSFARKMNPENLVATNVTCRSSRDDSALKSEVKGAPLSGALSWSDRREA
jgi:hypothetical protein